VKIITTSVITGLIAGALGALLILFAMREPEGELTRSEPERLRAIEDRLEAIEDDQRALRAASLSRDDLASALLAQDRSADIVALRRELESLRAAGGPESAGMAAPPSSQDELLDQLERRLAERREQARDEKASQRKSQERIWARAKNRNRARSFAEKYRLNEEQSERLATALGEREEADAALWGTLKSADVNAEERLAAIQQWRSNRQAFEQSARSFMSANQAEEVVGAINSEEQKVDSWLSELEASLSGQ
jgi:hypothetical protein